MKHSTITLYILSVSLVILSSCSSTAGDNYLSRQATLDIREFFNGNLIASGIVKKRNGEAFRHFTATIDASWDEEGSGTLDEFFEFDDGETQTRVWKLIPQKDGSYLASANDVDGVAKLRVKGNSIKMNYRLIIPYKNSSIAVNVDDRMYQVNPDTIINESDMSKFGVKLGAVSISIVKQKAEAN